MRVLVIARDQAEARQFTGLLSQASPTPVCLATATDLGAALRHLAEQAVDLILLDLHLPSGRDRPALEILRAQAPAAAMLAVSDGHDEAEARAALRGGADDCLGRAELTPQLLRHAVWVALERKHLGADAMRREPETIARLTPVARLASVGHLAAGVAHEVNNLLCALSNQLQVLQLHEHLDPELTPTLEAMEQWVRRAAGSVASLLEYALRPPGTRGPVDLRAVTSRMLTLLQGCPRFRHLEFSADFAPGLPALELDEAGWEQVVFELAANAAEASAARGALRVRARPWPGSDPSSPPAGIEVSFEDDGPGIAAEHLPRLFEPFFTTKAQAEHLGLGLTIVRGILLAHRGDIRVAVAPTGGTCVTVRLPAP